MDFLENKFFLIALTFVVFLGAKLLQRRTGVALLNPILISIIVLIVILLSCGVDYETYAAGGEYIEFWLKPAVVVCTGIFGGMAGFRMVKMSHIKSPIASGLSIGTASHAVGTASAMERGERYGAFSSLGLTLNGLLTALLSPFILDLLG